MLSSVSRFRCLNSVQEEKRIINNMNKSSLSTSVQRADQKQQQQSIFKVIFLGRGHVGKTGLYNRMLSRSLDSRTIGCCFPEVYVDVGLNGYDTKIVERQQQLADTNNPATHHHRVRLQLWDTCGQERFMSIPSAFYRAADAVLGCFSLAEHDLLDSVEKLDYWLEKCSEASDQRSHLFVVGCKADEVNDDDDGHSTNPANNSTRAAEDTTHPTDLLVSQTLTPFITKWREHFHMAGIFVTSAKQDHGVHALVQRVAETCVREQHTARRSMLSVRRCPGGVRLPTQPANAEEKDHQSKPFRSDGRCC